MFLCTGNSCRSIMAEALLARHGRPQFKAFSAGSRPVGTPHAMALQVLREEGFEVDHFRSKSWDEFSGDSAPRIDFVITVCNNAREETCPVWPGHPLLSHWDIEDPATAAGSIEEVRTVFQATFRELEARVEGFLATALGTEDPGAR